MTNRRLQTAVILSAVLIALAADAGAARLMLGEPVPGADGATTILPIVLNPAPGEEVAGLQCDILLNGTGLSHVKTEIGPAGQDAAKTLSANLVGPSKVRILLIGLNQNAMAEGVVANVLLESVNGAGSPKNASLDSVILSDPFGTRIPADSAGATSGSSATSGESLSPSQSAPWAALALLAVLCIAIFAITSISRRKRHPNHSRRPRAKQGRESRSC